jgi:glucokinase-like ROK family protein
LINNTFKGSNINLVKLHNLQVVLLSLLSDSSISRVLLAQKTRLSNSTISNLIAELIQQGIVSEENPSDLEANIIHPVGRPRQGIRLEPDARFVVGVHIGVGLFRVAMVNLRGEVSNNQIEYFAVDDPAPKVLDQMIAAIQAVIATSGVERSRILGVGVGASGLVDFQSGVNLVAPNLNWHNVLLRDYLQHGLQLPVVVDNNVRTMAIGEKYFGAGRDVDSLVFVYGRIGVGAGLIFKGEVFRGSTTGAGEIGHNVMLLEGGELCRCGNSGCLETLVSEPAILRQAEIIARHNPDGILARLAAQNQAKNMPFAGGIETVFAAARQGDHEVVQMLEKRAYYLGVAIAGLVNLFNPEMILFGGIYAQGQDLLLAPTIRTVHQMAFGGLGKQVQMQATHFGWKAGVIGAAALGLMYFFYQQTESSSW